MWSGALEARKDQAIALRSEEVQGRYIKYLTGCADMFRVGYIDVNQVTYEKISGGNWGESTDARSRLGIGFHRNLK